MGRRRQFLGASLAMVMALPMTVHAESLVLGDIGPPGDANTCSPAGMSVFPPAGSVPANLPFIELMPSPSYPGAMLATLTRRDTLDVVPFHSVMDETRIVRIALDAELVPGATYDFVAPPCGDAPRASFEYVAAEPWPLPTELGELESRIYASYPGLGEPRRYFVEATLVPHASMTPWLGGFYWWRISGDGIPEGGFLPRRVLTNDAASLEWTFPVNCWAEEQLIGPFLGNAAFLSGGETGAVTTPYTREQRSCGEAIVVDSAGVPLTPEQIRIYEDALHFGTFDVGTAPDAGPASIDGGQDTEPDTNPNCSASSSRTSTGLVALVLSTLAMVIRRRRHAR